ncbi:MAG: sensor histidine kinase [Candidatus Sumerlaeaceae bacterium]
MPCLNEEELAERKLREELFSAINHDLRSPLGAIGIFCEILLLNAADINDSQRQSLAMIQEANAKSLRILDDAAEIAAIYKGTLTLRLLPTSLHLLVSEASAKVADVFRHKDIHVEIGENSQPQIVIDDEKSQQVLLRVLEEAGAYCNRHGTVKISMDSSHGRAELRVDLECQPHDTESAIKRPAPASLKGRLGVRKIYESRYSLSACEKLMSLMGGSLHWQISPQFSAGLRFPTSSG